MKAWFLYGLVLLTSCAKDEELSFVSVTASCKMCSIELNYQGRILRDTVIGTITYTEVDNVVLADTTIATGRWNLSEKVGETVTAQACPLTLDSLPITINMELNGSVESTTSQGGTCAVHSRCACS